MNLYYWYLQAAGAIETERVALKYDINPQSIVIINYKTNQLTLMIIPLIIIAKFMCQVLQYIRCKFIFIKKNMILKYKKSELEDNNFLQRNNYKKHTMSWTRGPM